MRLFNRKLSLALTVAMYLLAGCSVAKLEARLEANPQCKDIINPKTGALMPCPETDKAFYRSVGLAPTKTTTTAVVAMPAENQSPTTAPLPVQNAVSSNAKPATSTVSVDCKPQIHKKTGGILPCPAPD